MIVSSVEGSLSKVALIDKEYEKAICSNGFYVINSNSLNSETILLLMKNIVGQSQLKRGCNGMILPAINKDEFHKIVLPVVGVDIQKKVQNIIIESLNLHKRSKKLLEYSKYAVETAIEKNEKTALSWLKTKLSESSH